MPRLAPDHDYFAGAKRGKTQRAIRADPDKTFSEFQKPTHIILTHKKAEGISPLGLQT
jgi:hypothetical protein